MKLNKRLLKETCRAHCYSQQGLPAVIGRVAGRVPAVGVQTTKSVIYKVLELLDGYAKFFLSVREAQLTLLHLTFLLDSN